LPFYEDFQPKDLLRHATAADAGQKADLRERLARQPASRRAHLLEEIVRNEVVKILGLDASRHVDPEQPMRELGMDSLMAVELRNGLALVVDRPLPATLLFDHPTIGRLVGYLGGQVLGLDLGGEVAQAEEETQDPGLELEALSEDQMAALLASRLDTLYHGENR
jgi:acyl carrier protein